VLIGIFLTKHNSIKFDFSISQSMNNKQIGRNLEGNRSSVVTGYSSKPRKLMISVFNLVN
jgi:hypothetical protein